MIGLPSSPGVYLVVGFVALILVSQVRRTLARHNYRQVNIRIREKLVKIVAIENEFVTVDASEVPGLNLQGLAAATEALEKLGFSRLLDYRLRRGEKTELQGFARLFVHPTEHCFAEIMGTGRLQPEKPLFVAINSYMEDGWRLGTSNIPGNKGTYFVRLPRVLRMRYVDDPADNLFARHLERRAEILRGLGIRLLPGDSTDFYFAQVREAMEQRKATTQQSNPLADLPLAEAQATARVMEWLGDYPREAKRLRAERTERERVVF